MINKPSHFSDPSEIYGRSQISLKTLRNKSPVGRRFPFSCCIGLKKTEEVKVEASITEIFESHLQNKSVHMGKDIENHFKELKLDSQIGFKNNLERLLQLKFQINQELEKKQIQHIHSIINTALSQRKRALLLEYILAKLCMLVLTGNFNENFAIIQKFKKELEEECRPLICESESEVINRAVENIENTLLRDGLLYAFKEQDVQEILNIILDFRLKELMSKIERQNMVISRIRSVLWLGKELKDLIPETNLKIFSFKVIDDFTETLAKSMLFHYVKEETTDFKLTADFKYDLEKIDGLRKKLKKPFISKEFKDLIEMELTLKIHELRTNT